MAARPLAHLGLHFCQPAAENLEEAVYLVGVPAEAGQQEIEVGQFGDPVWVDVVTSTVGQRVDSLSCWAHLKGMKVKLEAYKTHFMSAKLVNLCFSPLAPIYLAR